MGSLLRPVPRSWTKPPRADDWKCHLDLSRIEMVLAAWRSCTSFMYQTETSRAPAAYREPSVVSTRVNADAALRGDVVGPQLPVEAAARHSEVARGHHPIAVVLAQSGHNRVALGRSNRRDAVRQYAARSWCWISPTGRVRSACCSASRNWVTLRGQE